MPSYSLTGLIFRSDCSAAERAELFSRRFQVIFFSVKNLRKVGDPSILARGAFVEWIHSEGHTLLRPLNHEERDLAMGFPSWS